MNKEQKLNGIWLLRDPLLNKGTAFTSEERDKYALKGLLPYNIETIDAQLLRCRKAYDAKSTPLEQHIYLRALQDRNEVLFYRFILAYLEEMLPKIYTPIVGEACQQFHNIYRQARGLFISYPDKENIDSILSSIAATRDIKVIVVTDGERILGLGDQGVGGLGIPIGKLSLYTACGGVHPAHTLPIVLDVGTNNQERLLDTEYLGWRHTRVVGDDYYDFIHTFIAGIKRHFPQVLLQFEDFAQIHAYPLLELYKDKLCTFNDDIQGTAAVVVAAILAAVRVSGEALTTQRIALLGAGSAGCGISEQLVRVMINQGLSEAEARRKFYLVDRNGLLHDGMQALPSFQQGFVQPQALLKTWQVADCNNISLQEVIDNAKPTILLGVSGHANQFSETMVRAMAEYCERPIIFPLSNPTSCSEAIPADLLNWTCGKALVATGSPFDPVTINGHSITIAQSNNVYIFPGIGLAVVTAKIKRITDTMFMAAAIALSELSPALKTGEARLLPEIGCIRAVSQHIACAVILQAIKEGHADCIEDAQIKSLVQTNMWQPNYE